MGEAQRSSYSDPLKAPAPAIPRPPKCLLGLPFGGGQAGGLPSTDSAPVSGALLSLAPIPSPFPIPNLLLSLQASPPALCKVTSLVPAP